ncbi:hypothetical protein [Enterococcus sp. AZ126]
MMNDNFIDDTEEYWNSLLEHEPCDYSSKIGKLIVRPEDIDF